VARWVVLLRGINVSASTRIAMSDLREQLTRAGLGEVRTHLQSGNVLVTAGGKPEAVARKVRPRSQAAWERTSTSWSAPWRSCAK